MGTDRELQGHGLTGMKLPFREDSFSQHPQWFPAVPSSAPCGPLHCAPCWPRPPPPAPGLSPPPGRAAHCAAGIADSPPGEWAAGPFPILPGHRDAFTLGLSSLWKPTIFQRASLLPVVPHLSPACCADLGRECEMSATGNRRNNSWWYPVCRLW